MKLVRTSAAAVAALLIGGVAISAGQDRSNPPRMAEAPADDERWIAWSTARPGEPVRAMVQFDRVTADARVRALLSQANARPYAVYMYLEDRYGAHRTEPGKASLDLIEAARKTSVEMQEAQARGLQRRAEVLLADGFENRRPMAEALPGIEARRGASLAGLRRGVPIIYGVEVVGTAEALKALAGEAGVARVEPGLIVGDRIAVPDPDPPAARPPGPPPRRGDQELAAELRKIAGNGTGE